MPLKSARILARAVRLSSGALLAAASALAYGSLGVFAKLAYAEGWNIPSLLSFRFLFAALTVLPLALYVGGGWRGFHVAVALGALGYVATTALYFPSLQHLPAAIAGFLLYLSPVVVVLLAALFLHERITMRMTLALGLALLGLGVMSSGALRGSLSPIGILYALGSAVAFGITLVFSKRSALDMHWSRLSLGVGLGASATYFAFSLLSGRFEIPSGGEAFLWAAALGVVGTGIPLALFFAALARTGASQVSVISTLEPVSTLVLAAIFLNEVPDELGILGGVLILVAAAIVASQAPTAAPHE